MKCKNKDCIGYEENYPSNCGRSLGLSGCPIYKRLYIPSKKNLRKLFYESNTEERDGSRIIMCMSPFEEELIKRIEALENESESS
jgi:hypothetical protein